MRSFIYIVIAFLVISILRGLWNNTEDTLFFLAFIGFMASPFIAIFVFIRIFCGRGFFVVKSLIFSLLIFFAVYWYAKEVAPALVASLITLGCLLFSKGFVYFMGFLMGRALIPPSMRVHTPAVVTTIEKGRRRDSYFPRRGMPVSRPWFVTFEYQVSDSTMMTSYAEVSKPRYRVGDSVNFFYHKGNPACWVFDNEYGSSSRKS